MKKLYSLFALIALLFTASGCEDDYRSMVLFEGVEPIYQIGTCDNLVSNLSYYLSETNEDTVLGIDGLPVEVLLSMESVLPESVPAVPGTASL